MTMSSSDNSETGGKGLLSANQRRSPLRRILFWGFISCLILLIFILCSAAYIWVNRYAIMEDVAIDTLAEDGIKAELSIRSVSKTQAIIHNIRLSENGTEFFTSDKIVTDYDWQEIVKGRAERIIFTRPKGRITLDESGKITDGWFPHSQSDQDNNPSLPPEGIKVEGGTINVKSPYGEVKAEFDAEYFSADNFTAQASINPTTFTYADWHMEGGGDFDISLTGENPVIKTDMRLALLEHPALGTTGLKLKGDFIPITDDQGLNITGQANITFDTLTTAQFVTGPGQLGWNGQIFQAKKTAPDTLQPRLSFDGAWEVNLQDLSVPDPIRRRNLAQTLSLNSPLSKTPIAQNFAPELTQTIIGLLRQSSITGQGQTKLDSTGLSIVLDAPSILKSSGTTLTLMQSDKTPFYTFDKAGSEVRLAFHADLTNPAGVSLRKSNLVTHSENGWRLEGVKRFTADISTAREWTSASDDIGDDNVPARLSAFRAEVAYQGGQANHKSRDLRLKGGVDYDGRLPGAIVTGLKTGGELTMTITGTETLMQFAPQNDAPITISRIDTDTAWRAEDFSGRLLTQGPIYRRKKESSEVMAQIVDMSLIAIDRTDTRNLDIAFDTIDVAGTLIGETQNWAFETQMAKILSEDTPGPGTDIRMPTMEMEMWREPHKDLQFAMSAPNANAKTQLVTATHLAITAKGSPDNFILNYSPSDTQNGLVKFIGDALPPLPMTGVVNYKDAAFAGTARTALPFGEDTPIDVTYRFQNGAGTAHVDIPELRFTPNGLQPQSLVKALKGKIAEVDGAVSAQIKLAFAAGEPLQSSGTAQLKSLNFGTLPGPLSGVSTELSFSSFFPLQSQGRQTLSVASFDPGFPLENGTIEFELIPDGVKVYNARWPLGSGAISLEPFDWLYSAPENRVVMRMEAVSLGEFLDGIGNGSLEATGDIEGTLPIVMSGVNVKVDKGHLTVKNGGTIKYQSSQTNAAGASNEYAKMAFDALQDFNYRSLTAKMDGPLDGAIEVGMEFDGSNKDVLNNQPFRFNINIEGELLNILRSFNTNEQIKSELARRQLSRESLPPELE